MQQEQMPFQDTLGGEQMMRCLSIFLICTLLTCLRTVEAEENNTDADQQSNQLLGNVSDLKKMEDPFTFFLNTATSSLNGTYLWENPKKSPVKFGIDLGGTAVNGIQNIWGGEDNTSEYTANIFMAFPIGCNANEAAPVPNPQMVVELGISRSNYTFLEDTMPDEMSDKTRTQTQTSPSMFLYYSRNLKDDLLAGVSIGYAKLNNYATLPTRQIVKNRANTSADSEDTTDEGIMSTVILDELTLTAREGDYEEFNALQTSADLLFVPELSQYKIAFNLFFHYTFQHNNGHLFEPGFGIFSLRERKTPDTQNEDGGSPTGNQNVSDEAALNSKNGTAVSAPFPTNISMLDRVNLPWQIAYGVVGQWKDDLDEFRFGIVAGYNF